MHTLIWRLHSFPVRFKNQSACFKLELCSFLLMMLSAAFTTRRPR